MCRSAVRRISLTLAAVLVLGACSLTGPDVRSDRDVGSDDFSTSATQDSASPGDSALASPSPEETSMPVGTDEAEQVEALSLPTPRPFTMSVTEPGSDDVIRSVLDQLGRYPGERLRILGPEVGVDAETFERAIEPFERATGAVVTYEGTEEDSSELTELLAAQSPPDLVVIPQPGRLLDLAASGDALPVPDTIADLVSRDFDPVLSDLVRFRGNTYGVPNRASVKSLVWYNPEQFRRNGYDIPETFDELQDLSTLMREQGQVPWCVGISSGNSSGWPFTDWMEDVLLRLHGPDVYDGWTEGDIGFDDPRVVEAAQLVGDIWFADGNVLGGRESIASTTFSEAGLPVLTGECMMHRQASFYSGTYLDAGARVGPDGDVDAFYFPTISQDFGTVVLGAGNFVAPFTDRPATWGLLAYLASVEYADTRIALGTDGFVSPNLRHDTTQYATPINSTVAQTLVSADPLRFDASDLMPAAVGADEFWRSATAYVAGSITLLDFLDRTEAAWPTD